MYRCAHGHEHDDELVTKWGQEGIGDGYGPHPICTRIVESAQLGAGRVCGNSLTFVDGKADPKKGAQKV